MQRARWFMLVYLIGVASGVFVCKHERSSMMVKALFEGLVVTKDKVLDAWQKPLQSTHEGDWPTSENSLKDA